MAAFPTVPSGSNTFGTVLTDLAGAAQVGFGIYNETQSGGPAVNTNVLGASSGAVAPGAAAQTTFLGFSVTEIVIAVLLIVGVIVAVHFGSK